MTKLTAQPAHTQCDYWQPELLQATIPVICGHNYKTLRRLTTFGLLFFWPLVVVPRNRPRRPLVLRRVQGLSSKVPTPLVRSWARDLLPSTKRSIRRRLLISNPKGQGRVFGRW